MYVQKITPMMIQHTCTNLCLIGDDNLTCVLYANFGPILPEKSVSYTRKYTV